MHVRVLPLDVVLEVEVGETLMEAAWRLDYYWPTACYGAGQCTECRTVIEVGWENFDPPDAYEQGALDEIAVFAGRTTRLACQARVRGDAVVTKVGVRFIE